MAQASLVAATSAVLVVAGTIAVIAPEIVAKPVLGVVGFGEGGALATLQSAGSRGYSVVVAGVVLSKLEELT